MKKLFTLLTLCLLTTLSGWGADVTFVAGVDTGQKSVTKDGITISVSDGTFNRTDNYRCYANNTMTISSTVGNISKIVLNCTASDDSQYGPGVFSLYNSTGTYSFSGIIGTWVVGTVTTHSVTFKCNMQVRMTSIVVTYEESGGEHVATPKFSPEAGEVASGTEVSISTTTIGASIYYTTNGTDPTSSSQSYTAPVPITESTTFKAIAVKEGMANSEIASATYTIPSSVNPVEKATIVFNTSSFSGSSAISNLYEVIVPSSRQYVTSNTSQSYCYANDNGIRLSSASNAGSFTINLSDLIKDKVVTQIIVNAHGWSLTEGGQFSIDGLDNSIVSTDANTTYADYTINVNPGNSFNTLSFLGVEKKRVTIKYITLIFETPGAYTITSSAQPAEGGVFTGLGSDANAGDDIAFSVSPSTGFDLESVVVIDANNNVVTSEYNETDGKYHFVMPESNVTVTANFTQAGTLYILGQVNGMENAAWNPHQGVLMDYNNGKYSKRVYVTGLGNEDGGDEKKSFGFFAFSKRLATESETSNNGWDGINGDESRYGSGATGEYWPISQDGNNESHFGDQIPLYQNSQKSYRVPAGVYDIEVDFNTYPHHVKVTPVELSLALSPASGTFDVNKEVAITSNLVTEVESINANETRVAVTHIVSNVNNGIEQNGATAVLSQPGENIIVTGKAKLGYIEVTGTGTYTIENKFSIIANTNNNGTITIKVGNQVAASAAPDEVVTIIVSPRSGYQLSSLTYNETAIGLVEGQNEYTFTMPASDVTVTATFGKIDYTITTVCPNGEHGTVTGLPTTAQAGDRVEFTVVPESKYDVTVGATFGNGSMPDQFAFNAETGVCTFNMPAANVTVTINYTEKPVTRTFQLVKSEDDLVDGGKYMLVNPKKVHAMTGNASTEFALGADDRRMSTAAITLSDDKQTVSTKEATAIWTLQGGTGNWQIEFQNCKNLAGNLISGYLETGTRSDEHYMYILSPTSTTYNDEKSRTYTSISFGESGNAIIVFNAHPVDGSGRINQIMENSGNSGYWGPYGSTQDIVYLYREGTSLAWIEKNGEEDCSYTVADDLQVVWANTDKSVAWARDLAENINAVKVPTMGENQYDYMKNAGQQKGEWQQNNWVMLDFSDAGTSEFGKLGDLLASDKQPIIKGGTLSGVYTDDLNYTIKVSGDAQLTVEPSIANYVPNVYCAANYGADADGWQESAVENSAKEYWFMTPKVMEVATHTWSVWNGDGFYVPKRAFLDNKWFNEAGLVGAFEADWTYNVGGEPSQANGITENQAYEFLGVTMLKTTATEQPSGAPRRTVSELDVQPGSKLNTMQMVYPLNLNPDENIDQVVTGVERLLSNREVVDVTYCDVAGRMSSKPFNGINIIVTRYSDGTVTSSKGIY